MIYPVGLTLALLDGKILTLVDGPLLIAIGSVWLYWFLVVALSFYKRWKTGTRGAIRPRHAADRWLMRGWAIVIVSWTAFPVVALRKDQPPWGPFMAGAEMPLLAVRWGAAGAVLGCLLATCYCWHLMGRNWSVAIVKDDEDQQLVTTGLFGIARHPIYALSAMMIAATAVTCASYPMVIIAVTHIALLHIKAKREEQALIIVFGDRYRDYMKHTGSFVPKLFRRA